MNELLSCDTMVALGNSTKSGNVIFAKNSDRPLGESQPLCLFEAKDYPDQELLSCTYISIPQVSRTYKVLGSKPYWIWGFEHGMNEWGVAIGNEAVWSREEEERENGLLGMDLVRLGLCLLYTSRAVQCVVRPHPSPHLQGICPDDLFPAAD